MKFFKRIRVLIFVIMMLVLLGIVIYLNKEKVISILGNNQNKEAAYEPSVVSSPTRTTLLNFGSTKVDGIINSRDKTTINITLFATSDYCIRTVEFNSQTYSNEENENWLTLSFDVDEINFFDLFNIKITMASGEVYEGVLELKYLKLPNTAPSTPTITSSAIFTTIKLGKELTLIASNSADPENDSFTYVWEGRNGETATYGAGPHTARVKAVDEWGYSSDWATYAFNVISAEPPVLNYTKNNDRSYSLSYDGWTIGTESVVFEPSNSALTLTLNLDHIYDDSHVIVKHIVNNPTENTYTYRMASWIYPTLKGSDSGWRAICENVYTLPKDKGFLVMTRNNNTDQFAMYIRNTENVTNVTNRTVYGNPRGSYSTLGLWGWTGYVPEYETTQQIGNNGSYTISYSWQEQSIGPGETKEYSVIFAME